MAYTKAQVIEGRKCGLKYFDQAVAAVGRQAIIDKALEIRSRYPTTWGGHNLDWAVGNAVLQLLETDKNVQMTWNLDEAFTPEEVAELRRRAGITVPYTECWPRPEPKKAKVKTPKAPEEPIVRPSAFDRLLGEDPFSDE